MIEAYVLIMTATGSSPSLVESIREIDHVNRADIVAGEFDIIAIIEAESTQELLGLVTDEIHTLENVGQTRTSIVLE